MLFSLIYCSPSVIKNNVNCKISGSLRKQGLSPIVQQNQEFSIQNEDFPALPGYKGTVYDLTDILC